MPQIRVVEALNRSEGDIRPSAFQNHVPCILTLLQEKAFEKASELPEEEQDNFVTFILEELETERRWEQAFSPSKDELNRLADEALEERDAGTSEKLDPGQL